MARVLVVATPMLGHLGPLLTIGRRLAADHEVAVLTGTTMRPLVAQAGLRFLPLPPAAVGSVRDRPVRRGQPRWVAARQEIIDRFIGPLGVQAEALHAELTVGGPDLVLADTAYLGALPLLLGTPRHARPPVVGLSVTPLSQVSSDASPFGTGLRHRGDPLARQRNRQVNWLLHRGPLRPVQVALREALAPWRLPAGGLNYFDAASRFDATFQLGLPELEYPRRRLPDTVRCLGPVPAFTPERGLPDWWSRFTTLAGQHPVVHVTQGTVDNDDLDRLVLPTLRVLARREVVTVVSTGAVDGRSPVAAAAQLARRLGGTLPPRVFVTDFVPYDRLLPLTRLMITNGGWGGVQQAARHGVPLIVAGSTEEKPEVAARVAWSGLGVDLRTGTPSAARLARAVGRVLDGDRTLRVATALRDAAAARPDPVEAVLAGLGDVLGSPQLAPELS
ncbi:UDP:flavonoid glycosyltransferase YjiC (YdhE family) [Friedmanniella endophytica]|uniref:UDP:flavonoid glycosyltransferase YjiC (YdhE family) n=1 Tax=Microlunatus kandeliicorticis TaxID=1759536 RepID=A0A7W3P6G6_9ACTN|nr:glycosyltransferase [Microlunatus kandeliicorticis]MBA8795031.1 UDP:flavonoid glycosyltransferase YjiC (YdhE family) [Microlunatus kandeliicorticis]